MATCRKGENETPAPNPVRSDTERGLVSDLSKQPFSRRETTFPACCQDVVRRDSLAIPGLACRVGGMTFPANTTSRSAEEILHEPARRTNRIYIGQLACYTIIPIYQVRTDKKG